MREVLFRGKRVDNGEWVCSGNLIHFNEDNECYIPVVNSNCTCTHDENDNIIEWNEVMFCKVIPETVGQFTGMTDKNGKKIFEGDIVAGAVNWLERMKNGFVAFKDGSFGLIWYRGEVEQFNPFTSMCNVEYEVIGNIHDNPELLKGDE